MNEAASEVPRQVFLLKRLMIGFAVLLVCAALFLVAVGVGRIEGGGFGTASLAVPAGCTIGQASASGDRLVLVLGGTGDCRRILIADMKTGHLVGEFELKAP